MHSGKKKKKVDGEWTLDMWVMPMLSVGYYASILLLWNYVWLHALNNLNDYLNDFKDLKGYRRGGKKNSFLTFRHGRPKKRKV